MARKLFAQALMRAIALGDDHETARLLVEAMDDARPLDAANAGKAVAAMGEEGIDQRAAVMAGGGMHDQSRRLVDDDEVVILIDDVEFDRFRHRLGRQSRREVRTVTRSPALILRRASRTGSPSTATWPSAIRAWKRARLVSGKVPARKRSSRSPDFSASTVAVSNCGGGDFMSDNAGGEGNGPAIEVKQPGLKFLEAAVYIMGGLLVLMLIGLIGGIIWKATRKAPVDANMPAIVDIQAAPGTRVTQTHHRWRSRGDPAHAKRHGGTGRCRCKKGSHPVADQAHARSAVALADDPPAPTCAFGRPPI